MGNMANIPVGTKGEERLLVTSDVSIDFLGMESARVRSSNLRKTYEWLGVLRRI